MATRLKTIEYAAPILASLTDNTLTAMTTFTVYIPEFSGTVTFKSCVVVADVKEGAATATGNYTSRRIDVSVGGATAGNYINANSMTGSGENANLQWAADCTPHFVSNWTTGTSKTVAISVLIDVTHTTPTLVDACATLYITYEYDDAQTTQIKTVYIPLNAPTGALATSKPGTATATVPALDTELPESSKTIRSMFVMLQGNINSGAPGTTDSTISMQIDSLTAYTSGTLEMGAASDYWIRYAWPIRYYDSGGSVAGVNPSTASSFGWYVWGSVARLNHAQAWLVVTYEFSATASSNCFNSVMLPFKMGAAGGTASTDFQRGSVDLWIAEPATITTKQLAAYLFWEQAAAISTLNARLGTGSFVSYTNSTTVLSGSGGLMVRNDSAFSLARGKNTLTVDVYRTDSADFMPGLTGFLIVNYTSAKPGTYGMANHTVRQSIFSWAVNTLVEHKTLAINFSIPDANYLISAYGGEIRQFPNSTAQYSGMYLFAEKSNGAGQWVIAFADAGHTDAELGIHTHYFDISREHYRFPGDPDASRLDPEITRRWYYLYANGVTGWVYADQWVTYHSNTFTVSGTVTGYTGDGSGITVTIHRTDTGEKVASTTTSAGGSYSVKVMDDATVFAQARQSSTLCGRSDNLTPTSDT